MREGVEASKQNIFDFNLSSIWSGLLQDNKNDNSKLTTSPPVLTMDFLVQLNILTFRQVMLGMMFLMPRTGNLFQY